MSNPKLPNDPKEWKGPKPEVQFCMVCAMLCKGAAKDGHVTQMPEEAVTMGFPAILGPQQFGGNGMVMGIVPVCWAHLIGLAINDGTGLASPLEAPPGVLENLARKR